jgi:predicted GNAT superfamily acetyltransferase
VTSCTFFLGDAIVETLGLCELSESEYAEGPTGPFNHKVLMSLTTRTLQTKDLPTMFRINVEGDPGVGQVTEAELADLLSLAALPLGAFDGEELVGFVLCLHPKTRYASLNYAWFNARYDHFLYVDRIAVAKNHRNRQVGSLLYAEIIENAEALGWPIAAEVNLQPPNPGSMRFHVRYGFDEIGTLQHKNYKVAMVLRSPQ